MTKDEIEEFERYVAARHRRTKRAALWSVIALVAGILALTPFLAKHSLHRYWSVGRFLIPLSGVLLLNMIFRVGAVEASWRSARETRREFREPL